jgi:hypothetical protein
MPVPQPPLSFKETGIHLIQNGNSFFQAGIIGCWIKKIAHTCYLVSDSITLYIYIIWLRKLLTTSPKEPKRSSSQKNEYYYLIFLKLAHSLSS